MEKDVQAGLVVTRKTYRDGVAALVEVGARTSIDSLRGGLAALGIDEEQVRYLIVTHVHLDHAGAVGALAELWPWTRVVVHPSGARHVVDPGRLEASARGVYGERFDRYFGALVPVPGGVLVLDDDDTIIGAVGASGDTSDNDEAAVVAGIESVGLTPRTD